MDAEKKLTSMELVYQKIIQKIMNEQLTPGKPLREDRLAEEFGVSSTPVREAFRRLEYEGWVQRTPFCGCCLRKFNDEDIDELYQLREVLEGLSAAAAARLATEEELRQVKRILDDEYAYIEEARKRYVPDTALPTFQQDLDFHSSITLINHNRLLQQRLGMLKAQISCAFLITRSKPTSFRNLERVFEEHRMIYTAMERRWDDLAESLMRRDISDARKYLFKTL